MELTHFGHSCLHVDLGGTRLLFDPGNFSHGFEGITGLSAILITHQHPDHADPNRLPALVEANPDRLVWGSDWPHTNSGDQIPDGGKLLDLFAGWTTSPDLQRKILSSNAAKLYGF